MKKIFTIMFVLMLAGCLFGCSEDQNENVTTEDKNDDITAEAEGTMSYEEYEQAETGAPVILALKIKEKKVWEDSQALLYLADENQNIILYSGICSEAAYEELNIGDDITVFGYKAYVDGEAAITDASFEKGEK